MDFLIWGFEEFCRAHTTTKKSTPARVMEDAIVLNRLFDDQIEIDLRDLDFIGSSDVGSVKEQLDAISSSYVAKFINEHSS